MYAKRAIAVWTWLAALCEQAALSADPSGNLEEGNGPLGYPNDDGPYGSWGLCTVLEDLEITRSITYEEFRTLKEQLRYSRWKWEAAGVGFWWPLTPQGYRDRAAVCRELAHSLVGGVV